MLNKEFFEQKRQEVFSQLDEKSIAFVVSSDELPRNGDQTYSFRQSSDLFYLTGINQEQTILMFNNCHFDEEKREILFIRRSSEHIETWEGHKLTKEQASEISGIKNVKYTDEFDGLIGDLMFYADNVYLNTNGNVRYSRFYDDADYRFIEKLRYQFPVHTFRRLSPLLVKSRLIKNKQEIEVLKKAIDITKSAFLRVLRYIKPGVAEYEIQAEITHEFIKNQAYNHAYQPIVASGADNNILHYTENNKVCKSGELVLMDFGAEYCNYAADLSRTVPVSGYFDEFQRKVYKAVLTVQNEAKKLMKPGMTIRLWNKEVGKIMTEQLLDLQLITADDVKNETVENPAYKKIFYARNRAFFGA